MRLKVDAVGGKYTLNPNGDVWLKRRSADGATLIATVKNRVCTIFRSSSMYFRMYKGWGISYSLLLWKKSFQFDKVVVQTACTPKGHAFYGVFSRRALLSREPVQIPKQERQVIVKYKEMKRK